MRLARGLPASPCPCRGGTSTGCRAHARDAHAISGGLGGVRRHSSRGPPGRSLGRGALPPRRTTTPSTTLRPGSALRRRSTSALAEMAAGLSEPSPEWKVRYALMLGLERVLSEKPPHLASGTELRRHQVDALAGMLTELIAAVEKRDETERQRERQRARRGRGARRGGGRGGRRARRSSSSEGEADELPPARRRPGRRAPLPLPPPDRVRQDDRRGGLRRGGAHRGRPDPHPPPAARRPVPARADRPRLRRPARRHRPHRRDAAAARTRSRSRPTRGSRATSTRSRAPPTSS